MVPYLGFLIDSSSEGFRLIPQKKQKFIDLIRETLTSRYVSVKTLQRLVGKCISFSLAVRLFTREMSAAISMCMRPSKPITVQVALRDEITLWRNEQDFKFCQHCGYNRKILTAFNVDNTDINLESIDRRLRQLMDLDRATRYAKQEDSLRKEFETFLASLPGHITLATVTPRDICRFLVFKDKNGKMQWL